MKAKLPSSPALASRILALADNPDTPIEEFASAIQMDGALAARVLKMANAACMALRTPATTIHRAVTVLGLGRVRAAALSFQLVGHLNKLGGKNFNIKAYWQQSVLRACVGREIASAVLPSMTEEAFLVGLLCDGGVLLLVQLLGQEYAELYETGTRSPLGFFAEEKSRFPHNHVDAISAMAAEWNLPETIRKPLACHHTPARLSLHAGDVERLCALAHLIGSISFIEDGTTTDDLLGYAADQFGLTPDDLQKCLAAAGETYKHSAELLGDCLPDDVDVTDLLGEANRRLMAAAGEAESKVQYVEAQRDRIRTALGEYRELAARDPLTGLLNRGALTEATMKHLADARDQNTQITCLFLDVDNFKKLNDEYGHQTGDLVLKAVARAVPEAIVNAGSAGRYGGEEIILVMTGLDGRQSAAQAQQVVDLVRNIEHVKLGLKEPVTCSVGSVCGTANQFKNAEALFAAADEQMYIAKKNGKNRRSSKAMNPEPSKNIDSDLPRGSTTGDRENSVARIPGMPVKPGGGDPSIAEMVKQIADQLSRNKSALHVNLRKQNRMEMLTPCVIRLVAGPDLEVQDVHAYVRNISTTGIGVLTHHPMNRGDAIEVAIQLPGESLLYVAGLVAFCRHVKGPIHEVGAQLTAQAKTPIFSADLKAAVNQYGWLAEALGPRNEKGECR